MNHPPPGESRVLALGLDGATYEVLRPLADCGVMPHLARLMRQTALAVLHSTEPAITPVAWTTFQTGCQPHEHGILDFRYLDHREGRLLINHTGRIARPTLFQDVAAAGGQVVSLNLPMTYPAPGDVPGIIIGGLDSQSVEAVLAPYPEFTGRLIATSARYNLATIWKRRPQSYEELEQGVAQTEAAFRGRTTAAHLADEMTDWRLMVVHFQTLDSLQHRCWDLLGVAPTTAPGSWIRTAQKTMRCLDNCIGELCELADRRQAALVLVSDHGFGPFRGKISLPALFGSRGLTVSPSWVSGLGYRLARSHWKLRKWTQRQMRPGRSAASLERPLGGSAPIDWRRSVAVALHGNLAALVYFNTPKRFGRGPVNSPSRYDQVSDDVLAALREAVHPETGERLFLDAYSVAERHDLDPLERCWPDAIAIPADGFHTRHKFDRQSPLVLDDPLLTGTHRRDGILMIRAPGVRRGWLPTAELRDVAPTILRLLGLGPGGAMSGRVVESCFAGPDLQPPRPHFLDRRPAAAQPPTFPFDDTEAVEERLRELGYLE